jgi:hypothetical protein
MDDPSRNKEKRKHARTQVSLPLHFKMSEKPNVYPGLTIDASESGLLIQTFKDMPVESRLNIEVSFPEGFESSHFKGVAEIIWKDICNWEGWEGFMYGLKFIQISYENYLRLKKLLDDPSSSKNAELIDNPESKSTLIVKVEG